MTKKENKNHVVTFRLTKDEHELMKELTRENNVSTSDLIRENVLGNVHEPTKKISFV